jgi:hypothetical protein|tara:strand:+ start:144 stop:263 length:120 start_codon:yes stop_codon:yes gene_type:complete
LIEKTDAYSRAHKNLVEKDIGLQDREMVYAGAKKRRIEE